MLIIRVSGRDEEERTYRVAQSCRIGKDESLDIVLKGWLVGRLQADIVRRGRHYFLEDKGGVLATTVNGNTVTSYGPLTLNDVIEIGPYTLTPTAFEQEPTSQEERIVAAPATSSVPALQGERLAQAPVKPATREAEIAPAEPAPQQVIGRPQTNMVSSPPDTFAPVPVLAQPEPDVLQDAGEPGWDSSAAAFLNSSAGVALRKSVHARLISAMDLRRVNVGRMSEAELRQAVGSLLDEICDHDPAIVSMQIDIAQIKKSVADEVIGLGPLEVLLNDDTVSEVMVNRYNEIFVERSGKLTRSPVIFTDDAAVLSAIERIVAPLGRRIDESSPMVDARLKDGSRVNAVIPPLALKGPNLTIRKFARKRLSADDLVRLGTFSRGMVEFLRVAVERRANVVISGGTGSGKTTLLNLLSTFIPDNERIVTVEDAAELQLSQQNLVSLEARPPNMEGKGAVTIRELVKNCLRMRPDRIVVGECRGGEALDMLQAMNTGHDGSLTTAHANSPRDCLSRLEVMTLMAGLDLPISAIREQVVSAIDIIVQQTRFSCGTRRVTHITEVCGMESGVVQLQDIFLFRQQGYGPDGKVMGTFEPTSYVPDFYQDLIRRGIAVDTAIFTANQ